MHSPSYLIFEEKARRIFLAVVAFHQMRGWLLIVETVVVAWSHLKRKVMREKNSRTVSFAKNEMPNTTWKSYMRNRNSAVHQ
jgi:hypothetical protein